MPDIVSQEKRSQMMAGIKAENTGPERQIRSLLYGLGFRYRIHVRNLPGKPDLVFTKYHAVIFVHGCFWHGHECSLYRLPSTNTKFWREKIEGNRLRDSVQAEELNRLGWKVLVIWECSLRGKKKIPLPNIGEKTAEWLKNSNSNLYIHGHE